MGRTINVQAGQEINDLYWYGISIDENLLNNGPVSIYFVGIDNDKLPYNNSFVLGLASDIMSAVVSAIITPAAGIITTRLIDGLKNYIEEADIIGDGLVVLETEADQRIGGWQQTTSPGMQVDYRINRIENIPYHPSPQPMPTRIEPTPAPTLANPPQNGWRMSIERGPEPPLIVGSLPYPGIEVTITNPFDTLPQHVLSGEKSEYGPGGFGTYSEYCIHHGDYTVAFLDQKFTVPMNGQFTKLTFVEG